VGIEDEIGVAGSAVGHDAGGQDLVVDPAQRLLQEDVEDLLVLDPLAVVDLIDARGNLVPREREACVAHPVDSGVDRGPLHLHEVGQRVVEIEDDGSDHDRSDGPRSARGNLRGAGRVRGCERSYLLDGPMARPRLISPLSMRTLKPQVGLVQTQAL
jgi:hypothetical protein